MTKKTVFLIPALFVFTLFFFYGCNLKTTTTSWGPTFTPTLYCTPTITPTTIPPSRLSSVTEYAAGGAYAGVENYAYDASGMLLTDIIKDSTNTETKRFVYQYDINGRVNKISYYVSGALTMYSVPAYNGAGKVTSYSEYDASDVLQYTASFTYDGSGHVTRKDLYQQPGTALIEYFIFNTNTAGLITQLEIYTYSGTGLATITQTYDAGQVMQDRHFYMPPGSLIGYYTYAINASEQKTGLSFYDASSILQAYADYVYEPGIANLDENHVDYYETLILDTGTY